MLNIGDKVLLTTKILNSRGEEISLSEIDFNKLVVYFYPKDSTPGCTKQACSFRDLNSEISALGAKVVGVSKDPLKSHEKFSNSLSLNFELLSDPDHKLMEDFDVWQEKTFMGKTYMGTVRATYIINKNGEVLDVIYDGCEKYGKVSAEQHAELVLNFLKENQDK